MVSVWGVKTQTQWLLASVASLSLVVDEKACLTFLGNATYN